MPPIQEAPSAGLQLQPGQRHTLKVEWDLIDPSYIALLHRDPLPAQVSRLA